MVLHATLIALRDGRGWRGALLRGGSGAGKSDLALRALDADFRLVADDRVLVWTSGGRAFGRAPATLRGLLEVRRAGVLRVPALAFAPVSLIVDLGGPEERVPDEDTEPVAGVAVPLRALAPFEAGAVARLRAMLIGETAPTLQP